ncbi:nitrogenase component 1 [Rhodovulum strictum]|uniref:Oxidoreductase n=1 Tax=Rhodovulum strictum TaxID=58314 RepID=A0A844BKD1_9RHOB|nr:nitrogenase component 1 [Rhodovulum strictum]MRH21403.1 oxidoreductase [Rhodovulum strictum]
MARRRNRIQPRETRLDAVGAFIGDVASLAAEYARDEPPPPRIRTFSEAEPDDLSVALELLGRFRDLGLVVHGPRGCAAVPVHGPARLAVTDLDQQDTVLGSGEALAETVRRLDATARPAAIAVLGTPVVAINNDDIQATVGDLCEELGKPVVWVQTNALTSRIAATGADAAALALVHLANPEDAAGDLGLLNLLVPAASPEVDDLVSGIEAQGWKVNLLSETGTVADLARAATAAASLVLDPDTLEPLAAALEDRRGVPQLPVALPVGHAATAALYQTLADIAGTTPVIPLTPARTGAEALAGRRIAIALAPGWALALAQLVEDLGGEVVLLSVPHIDRRHAGALAGLAARRAAAQIHVGAAQGFEHENLLRRLAPDLVLGDPAAGAHALRLGIPAAAVVPERLIGPGAVERLDDLVRDALAGSTLALRAARGRQSPYSPGWLRRSPDWHVKREVK